MPYEIVHFDDDVPQGGAPWGVIKDDKLTWTHLLKEQRGSADHPLVCDIADTKFLEYRFDCGATSGDNRGMYLRLYTTGAGGGGDCARIYHEVVGVAAANAFGAHISLGFGESTIKGAITGLGVAMRATLGLPDGAMASGGNYAAIMAEIYSFGAGADPGAVQAISYFRVVNDGDSDGKSDVDDDVYLFDIQGHTIDTGKLVEVAADETGYAWNIKIRVGSQVMYLMCADDRV